MEAGWTETDSKPKAFKSRKSAQNGAAKWTWHTMVRHRVALLTILSVQDKPDRFGYLQNAFYLYMMTQER